MIYRYSLRPRLGSLFACLLGISLLCGLVSAARSSDLVEAADAAHAPNSGFGWYELLIDDTASRPLPEIIAAAGAGEFLAADQHNVNQGFTHAHVWAHFRVRYAARREVPLVLVLPRPLLDHVDLFSVAPDGAMNTVRTGDVLPFAARALDYRAFAFELAPIPGASVDYYLRVSSRTSAIGMPLRLLEPAEFRRLTDVENFLLGAYFGVVGALAIAAILLFATVRAPIFLYYFLYISAFTLTVATISGYGMQMLWPGAPALQQLLPTLLATLTLVVSAVFVSVFLSLAERWRSIERLFFAIAAVAVGGAVMHLGFELQIGAKIVVGAVVVFGPLMLIAALRCARAGDRAAHVFVAGWVICMSAVIAAGLDMLGVIPQTALSTYGLYFGSLAEFVALAIGIGMRTQRLQHEREEEIARTNAELAALNQNLDTMVQQRTRELEARNSELGELAIRDSLTGLYNHSTTVELLDQVMHQSQRYEFPVTVLMIDIDHFKRVNDRFGHQVGDAVLERVCQTLTESVREADIVGRYGGEEFLVAMSHADAVAGREFSERLLARVRRITIPHSEGEYVTVSIGISVYNPRGPRLSATEMVRRADQALYRSKRDGRDRLTVDGHRVVAPVEDHVRRNTPSTTS